MKTVSLSPKSVKQINPITMEDSRSKIKGERESNYFPGCRKDANCDCKICLESITATLDLMPMSVQRSSLTKLSASKPAVEITPVSIDPTLLSTPTSRTPPAVEVASSRSAFRSTAKTNYIKNFEPKKRKSGLSLKLNKWVVLLGLILGLEIGFSWAVPRVLQPEIAEDIVRDVVEKSTGIESLSERLTSIQKALNKSVDGKVSSCILGDSTWRINQDGLMLISYCNLYQSAAVEVSFWGWPLETSGLLIAEFSSRSFNILSGSITEWPEGKLINKIREANTGWILRKWTSSVVRFEPNTWVIEYKRNCLVEKKSILQVAVEFINFRIFKLVQRMKHQIWYLPELRDVCTTSTSDAPGFSIPT